MDIRSDRQKGLSYTELGKKYHMDPRTVINIKGESYRPKERKEFMRQKQQIVNTLFAQGNT